MSKKRNLAIYLIIMEYPSSWAFKCNDIVDIQKEYGQNLQDI